MEQCTDHNFKHTQTKKIIHNINCNYLVHLLITINKDVTPVANKQIEKGSH